MEPALTPLAHLSAEHWWVSVLYAMPALIVVGSIVAVAVRDRRRTAARRDLGSEEG